MGTLGVRGGGTVLYTLAQQLAVRDIRMQALTLQGMIQEVKVFPGARIHAAIKLFLCMFVSLFLSAC